MADITITIDDSIYPQVAANFGKQNSYNANIRDPQNPLHEIPNPETLDQFFARKLAEFAFESSKSASAITAAEAARTQAIAAADANKALFMSRITVQPKP